jgi:hypothetical protein
MRGALRRWWLLVVPVAALLAAPAPAAAGTATQFLIFATLSGAVDPGTPFQPRVTAVDDQGNSDFTFSGTARFTSSDPQATLPPDTTIANGPTDVSLTMRTVGLQTITATQIGGNSITGTGAVVIFPSALMRMTADAPSLATSGVPLTFTVAARDRQGDPLPSYDGAVHFTSSDPAATLPPDTRLANGTGTITATLRTAGAQTITATDVTFPTRFRTTVGITVERPATHLQLAAPLTTLAGFPALVGVRALDATGAVAGTFGGTVRFTSTDPHAQLPADVKLVNGQATAMATFDTTGRQTISAADTGAAGIAGTSPELLVGVADPVPVPQPPTGSVPPGVSAPPLTASAPAVRGLAVKPLCVRKAALLRSPRQGRGALAVSFALSATARVSVSVARLVHAAAPARCPKRAGSTAGAVKVVKAFGGSVPGGRTAFAVAAAAGRRTVPLAGSAAAKALAPGAYLVQVRATDAAGRRSALATAKFFVLR